jgi:hypothetical protein
MRNVKLVAVALVAALASVGAITALAGAAPVRPETLYLNSYTADDSSGGNSAQASTTLTVGKKYLIEVKGTFSAWQDWTTSSSCGTPGAAPIFDSPGLPTTPTGDDAVFRFASPRSAGSCPAHTYPYVSHLFQINLGSGWQPFTPIIKRARPTANHTYFTVVTGQGSAPLFRVVDWHPSDNDGELRITIF